MADTQTLEAQAINQTLLKAHFSNRGLQYLVQEAATLLGNPIVVVDPTYHYVAYHMGPCGESCDAADPVTSPAVHIMTDEIANEALLDDAMAYIRDTHIDSRLARSKGPLEQYNELLSCNTLTSAVMVRGVCIAHVMMLEANHPFASLDRDAFVFLNNIVAQEMQKSEIWGPTSGELGSYFLESLLSDPSPSARVTRRRLKALNFHPKELLYVVCLHAPGKGLEQAQAENIAGQLRPFLHHALYTRHHQQLICLLSRDADVGFSPRAEAKLREVATLNGLTVGVSNIYTDILGTRQAYEQARAAVRYGEMATNVIDDDRVFLYCNYAYLHLLNLAGRRIDLLSLCHPALLSLMDYDNAHGGELMETLFCYLQVAGSTARAAELLTLHKNTMLYRLGRIRKQLSMDLSNGEDLFMLQTSFRILINLGLFTPRLHLQRAQLQA